MEGTIAQERQTIELLENTIENNEQLYHWVQNGIQNAQTSGSITRQDAASLRVQLQNTCSGNLMQVYNRLKQLRAEWNPYQSYPAPTMNTTGENSLPAKLKRKTIPKKDPIKSTKEDFYSILGIHKEATIEEIKKAYRTKALQSHPDKRKDKDISFFARISLAYETLVDMNLRAMYDAQENNESVAETIGDEDVSNQLTLEGNETYATFEWLRHVRDKMDVLECLGDWSILLKLPLKEIRFEQGVDCNERDDCRQFMCMDRDLELRGSKHKRVFVCLEHRYVHACDTRCSCLGLQENDERVCTVRARWLCQCWVAENKGQATAKERVEQDLSIPKKQQPSMLGKTHEQFKHDEKNKMSSFEMQNELPETCCFQSTCEGCYVYLDRGIWVCPKHSTCHVCSFEQCSRLVSNGSRFECWVSHRLYGYQYESLGAATRNRLLVYKNQFGEETCTRMEVPTLLPLGETTSFLLLDNRDSNSDSKITSKKYKDDNSTVCELSDDVKVYCMEDIKRTKKTKQNMEQKTKQNMEQKTNRNMEQKTNRKRSMEQMQLMEMGKRARKRKQPLGRNNTNTKATPEFIILLKIPDAIAAIPSVALELTDDFLPIQVSSSYTLGQVKNEIEAISGVAPFDQELLLDGTTIDEGCEGIFPWKTTLGDLGISSGREVELRLHRDCPALVATWNESLASGKSNHAHLEYNTLQISKEAEEDLIEQQEQWENVIMVEEDHFQTQEIQRNILETRIGAGEMEVVEMNGRVPRLLGTRVMGQGTHEE